MPSAHTLWFIPTEQIPHLLHPGNNLNLNGEFLQAGGQAIRIVDPNNMTSTLIGQLDRNRVGITLTTLGDGNLLIMGGNQQVCLCLCLCLTVR